MPPPKTTSRPSLVVLRPEGLAGLCRPGQGLGRHREGGGRERLVDPDVGAGEPRVVHPLEGDRVPAAVDDRDVHRNPDPAGLPLGGLEDRLRRVQSDGSDRSQFPDAVTTACGCSRHL